MTAGVGSPSRGGGKRETSEHGSGKEDVRVPPAALPTTFHFPLQNTEEAIPELEIDVDELLDMESDKDRAARVKDLLVDCYKPTEDFVVELLDKIRGMQKLSTPQKK